MRKRVLIGVGAMALGIGAGTAAWKRLHPPPAPPPPVEERTLDQIPQDEYAKWMEDLGYHDGGAGSTEGK